MKTIMIAAVLAGTLPASMNVYAGEKEPVSIGNYQLYVNEEPGEKDTILIFEKRGYGSAVVVCQSGFCGSSQVIERGFGDDKSLSAGAYKAAVEYQKRKI